MDKSSSMSETGKHY